MTQETHEAITLGADVGGPDVADAIRYSVLSFRKLLAVHCCGPYSSVIREFGLVLRIDGSIQAWHRTGVDAVVIRNRRYIATADIYVPRKAWDREDDGTYFRKFLATGVKAAIDAIVRSAVKKKVDIQHEALLRDLDDAITAFLVDKKQD